MLFIGSAIDLEDHITANAVYVVKAMAAHSQVAHVSVLGLRVGRHDFGPEIPVTSLEHPLTPSLLARLITLVRFYWLAVRIIRRESIDVVYCYMTPTYPLLLCPIRLVLGTRVCLWYGHTSAGTLVKLSISYCVDRWFTANKSTTPFQHRSLRLVGQGVDQDLFRSADFEKDYDFITVGRISPIKKLDVIIEALAVCAQSVGRDVSLEICGETVHEDDEAYLNQLTDSVRDLNLGGTVAFAGKIDYIDMPGHYNRARSLVFATPGGVSKVVMEAMSCAIPAVIAEPGMTDFLPEDLAAQVLCERDPQSLGRKMAEIINLTDEKRRVIGTSLRELVEEKYNLTALTDSIVTHMVEATA